MTVVRSDLILALSLLSGRDAIECLLEAEDLRSPESSLSSNLGDLKATWAKDVVEARAGSWADKLSRSPKIQTLDPWRKFDEVPDHLLGGRRSEDLRKYASKVLGIRGASRLRKFSDEVGPGLVETIVQFRSRRQ